MRTSLWAKPLQFHAPALKRAEKSLHHIAALDPQGYRSLLAPRRLLELAILVVAQSDDPGVSDGAGAGVQRWRWRLVFAAIRVQHPLLLCSVRHKKTNTGAQTHNVVGTDNAHLLEVVNEYPAIWL